MTLPVRRCLPHDVPLGIRPDAHAFFLTINCQQRGTNQLCREPVAALLLDAARFRHQRGDWWLELILLMPDHLHLLAWFPLGPGMARAIQQYKSYTTKQAGILWQRGFFDHRLRREQSIQQTTEYILLNPVRRGLCSNAEDWPYRWMAPL